MVIADDLVLGAAAADRGAWLLLAMVVASAVATVASARRLTVACVRTSIADELDSGVVDKGLVQSGESVRREALHIYADPERGVASCPPRLKAQLVLKQVMRAQIALKAEDVQIGRRAQKFAKGVVLRDALDTRKEAMTLGVLVHASCNGAPRDLGASGEAKEGAESIRDGELLRKDACCLGDLDGCPDMKVRCRIVGGCRLVDDADGGRRHCLERRKV